MKPLSSVVPCLQCGKRGRWKTDAYASSRAMIEQGKVCPDCYSGLLNRTTGYGYSMKWKGLIAR